MAAWAGKEKPPNPWQGERQRLFRGDRAINGNRVKAQGPKGKVRAVSESPKRSPAHFTSLLAKGMVDAGVPITIELGVVGPDGAGGTVTAFEDWKRTRAR